VSDKNLKRTALYEAHVKAGARLVPFAGYEMPVQYSGVIDEHKAVRETVGLFDVSHMGEVEFRGPQALDIVNRIITNDLEAIADGQACYTVMVKPEGGIIDDLIVYRFSPERIFIVVNASNRDKDFAWMVAQANGRCDVIDRSDEIALIAVQGPKAVELVGRLAEQDVSDLQRFRFVTGKVAGKEAMIARTGYTGEDGYELYLDTKDALHVWYELLEKGKDLGVKPVGLGARDSLRLEMKYALYGNDIDETTNPFEAGLGWTVKLKKREFVGKEALEQIKASGPRADAGRLRAHGSRHRASRLRRVEGGEADRRGEERNDGSVGREVDRHRVRTIRARGPGHRARDRDPRQAGEGGRGEDAVLQQGVIACGSGRPR
jgi:aminomethyltransferase